MSSWRGKVWNFIAKTRMGSWSDVCCILSMWKPQQRACMGRTVFVRKHDLDPTKKYVANVVYSEVLQDRDSDR